MNQSVKTYIRTRNQYICRLFIKKKHTLIILIFYTNVICTRGKIIYDIVVIFDIYTV